MSELSRGWADFSSTPEATPLERAKRVMATLERHTAPVYPTRPDVPLTDFQILKLADKMQKHLVVSAEDRQNLTLWGAWRATVLRLESQAVGVLTVLLHTIVNVEEEGKHAAKLRRWVAQQWGREVPRSLFAASVPRVAEALAYRMDLLPKHLRTLEMMDAPQDVRDESSAKAEPKKLTYSQAYTEEPDEL